MLPRSLAQELLQRLEAKLTKLSHAQDVIEKEKRIFPVMQSNVLFRNLVSFLPDDPRFDVCKASYTYGVSNQTFVRKRNYFDKVFPSACSDHQLMQPFYSCLEVLIRDDTDLKIKLSSKTMLEDVSMSDTLLRMISTLQSQFGRLPDFRELVEDNNESLFNWFAPFDLDPICNSYISELIEISYKGMYEFLPMKKSIEEIQTKFNINVTPLELHTKAYANRGDLRAYYVDKDVIRATSGAIISAILNDGSYKSISNDWRTVYPKYAQNKLDEEYIIQPGEECWLLFGDISSFTASFVGTWLGLLTLLVMISANSKLSHLKDTFAVQLHNKLFTARITDVIFIYLLCTVGARAIVNDEIHITTGGYLGVTGNITISMFALSILFLNIQEQFPRVYRVRIVIKLGGDDFHISMVGSPNCLHTASLALQTELKNTVGEIKDLIYIKVSTSYEGKQLWNVRYCQKLVEVERRPESYGNRGSRILVKTIDGLPIMSTLVEPNHTLSKAKTKIEYFSYLSNLSDYFDGFSDKDYWMQVYSDIFRLVYSFYDDEPLAKLILISSKTAFRRYGSYYISNNALVIVANHPVFADASNVIRGNHELSRIRSCCALDLLKFETVLDPSNEEHFDVIIAPNERYPTYRSLRYPILFSNNSLACELSLAYMTFGRRLQTFL